MKIPKLIMAFTGLALISSSVLAATDNDSYTPESQKLLNSLQDEIRSTLIAVSKYETQAGKDMRNFHYTLALPAHEITYLGMVLNLDNEENGFEVLSVTPGGSADKLAIKSQDRVLEINNIKVNSSNKDATIAALRNLRRGDSLDLVVSSANETRELTTKLEGQYVPPINIEFGLNENSASMSGSQGGCGIVSISTRPPESRDIYPATFHKINKDHLKRNRNNFILPVGKHTIYLHDGIDDQQMRKRNIKAKPIEIVVKANTVYHLGAKFNRSKKYKTVNGDYWTPVIWKTATRECK